MTKPSALQQPTFKRYFCPSCGYDVSATPEGSPCSECGEELSPAHKRHLLDDLKPKELAALHRWLLTFTICEVLRCIGALVVLLLTEAESAGAAAAISFLFSGIQMLIALRLVILARGNKRSWAGHLPWALAGMLFVLFIVGQAFVQLSSDDATARAITIRYLAIAQVATLAPWLALMARVMDHLLIIVNARRVRIASKVFWILLGLVAIPYLLPIPMGVFLAISPMGVGLVLGPYLRTRKEIRLSLKWASFRSSKAQAERMY